MPEQYRRLINRLHRLETELADGGRGQDAEAVQAAIDSIRALTKQVRDLEIDLSLANVSRRADTEAARP